MKNLSFFLNIKLKNKAVFFGKGPANLLLLIDSTSSLKKATEKMNMSYTKGVKIINLAEKELGYPIITRTTGGAGGGGSTLTKKGRAFLLSYNNFVKELEDFSKDRFKDIFENEIEIS